MERLRPWSLALVLACVLAAPVSAATRAYFVEPKTALNSWTPYQGHIGQTFTANVDSIAYIEWFVGELSVKGVYRFSFEDKATNQVLCWGEESVPARGWQWVKCSTFTGNLRLTKGKEYLLRVSHSEGDSVNYVYRADNPYKYGRIEVGGGGWGQSEPVEFRDLVARVHGRNTPLDSLRWGSHVRTLTALLPAGKPYGCWGDSSGGRARAARAAEAGIRLDRDYVSMHVLWPDKCPNRTDRTLCYLPALPTPA